MLSEDYLSLMSLSLWFVINDLIQLGHTVGCAQVNHFNEAFFFPLEKAHIFKVPRTRFQVVVMYELH